MMLIITANYGIWSEHTFSLC